eukprot:g24895.t1
MDIQSLYTCILHMHGLKALNFFLSRRPNQFPSTDTLICLTELVLTLNNFSFNSSHFIQTKEVAMGTCMDPSYACFFVGNVEQSLFCCYTGTIPHLFLHYIDCIGAASCSHEELEQFINFTNTFHPNLKFTWTISDTSLSFLDLSISISDDCLVTDIYFKPTNSRSYLDYTTSHPRMDHSLRDSLVHSTLPTNPTIPGTFSCKRGKCYTCPYTSPLTSIQGTKQTLDIRHGFTCAFVNLVYCICRTQCGFLY